MQYSHTLSLECPHCITKCQFSQINASHTHCSKDNSHHIAYICTNCNGVIVTKWQSNTSDINRFESHASSSGYVTLLDIYYPLVGDWKARVDLSLINDIEIQTDFRESISCYNNGFYNSSMMMARRAIQQVMIIKKAVGKNLYEQIESSGISPKLKILLHKIKNFGNYGAHPDFCLFDAEGNKIQDKKEFARLSLEFLDRYFSDEYEIDSLIENAPKSGKELKK